MSSVFDHVSVKATERVSQTLTIEFEGILSPFETKSTVKAQYYTKQVIGKGAYGHAILVEEAKTAHRYVAKIMDLRAMTPKDRLFALSEVRCLAKCAHPNIIRLRETHERSGKLLLIMEHADEGDLGKQIIARTPSMYYREIEVLFIFLQLCLAVDYLHQKRMMHRDLKTANVFLTSNGLVKLGDFGFSRQYEDTLSEDVGNTFCGTPYYVAPELWRRQPYSKKAEMWSLGVILYELLTLVRPFYDQTIKLLVPKVLAGEYAPIQQKFNPFIIQTCNALLTQDPDHRPLMREIMATPFMQSSLQLLSKSVAHNANIDKWTQDQMCRSIEIILADGLRSTPSPRITRSSEVRVMDGTEWVEASMFMGDEGIHINIADATASSAYIDISKVVAVGKDVSHVDNTFAIYFTDGTHRWVAAQNEIDMDDWMINLQKCLRDLSPSCGI